MPVLLRYRFSDGFTWHLWTLFFAWVRKHDKCDDEIKQFSKVETNQNISTVILLIKFLVYQWDPRHLQGTRVVLYMCISIIRILFTLIISEVYKDLSNLRMKNWTFCPGMIRNKHYKYLYFNILPYKKYYYV